MYIEILYDRYLLAALSSLLHKNDNVLNSQSFCPFSVSRHYSCPRKPWKYATVFCCEIRVFTCGMSL